MRSHWLIALLLLPSVALGFDFKGIAIGAPATPEQVQEKLGVRCGAGADGKQVCNGNVTIAQERSYMILVISAQGVVQRIFLSLSPEAFDIVAPLLLEKFGPAASTSRSQVQNRMGAKFDQVIHLWKDEQENQVFYSRYSGTVDKSVLSFTTKEDRGMLNKNRGNPKSDI